MLNCFTIHQRLPSGALLVATLEFQPKQVLHYESLERLEVFIVLIVALVAFGALTIFFQASRAIYKIAFKTHFGVADYVLAFLAIKLANILFKDFKTLI